MSIHASCDQCGKPYEVPDNLLGRRVKCAGCGATFTISTPLADLGSADDLFASELGAAAASGSQFDESLRGDPLLGTAAGGKQLPPSRPLKSGWSSAPGGGGGMQQVLATHKLLIAVGIGMAFVALSMAVLLATRGFGPRLIPGAVLLAIGTVILVGGWTTTPGRRKQLVVKARAIRALGWCLGGLASVGVVLGVMRGFAQAGYSVPSVVQIGTPFLAVGALVAVSAAVVLAYQILVMIFPRVNIFRIGGWVYVGVTIALPILGTAALLAGKAMTSSRRADRVAEGPPPREPPARVYPRVPASPRPSRPVRDPLDRSRNASPQPDSGSLPSSESAGPAERHLPSGPRAFRGPPGPRFGPRGPRPRGGTVPDSGRARRSDRPGPRGPSDFDSRRLQLEARLGVDNVVTVVVHNVRPGEFSSLQSQIRDAVDGQVTDHEATARGGTMRMALGPVADAEALARKLPFDKVTVHPKVRMIVVELPPPTMK